MNSVTWAPRSQPTELTALAVAEALESVLTVPGYRRAAAEIAADIAAMLDRARDTQMVSTGVVSRARRLM